MPRIEHTALAAPISGLNTAWKAYLAFLMTICCIVADSIPYSVLVTCVMVFCGIRFSGIAPRAYAALMAVPEAFVVVGVITVALRVGQTPPGLLSVHMAGVYVGFSEESLVRAANLLLKSMGCVASQYFLLLTTPVPAVIGLLYRSPLPRVFSELTMLTYRFIHDLLGTLWQMNVSRKLRLGERRRMDAIRSAALVASGVFVRSFKRSEAVYAAMELRGYDGAMPWQVREAAVSGPQAVLACTATALMGVLLVYVRTAGGFLQ